MSDASKRNGAGAGDTGSFARFENLARTLFTSAKPAPEAKTAASDRPVQRAARPRLAANVRRLAMSLLPGHNQLRCSFCGKDKDHVQFLIAGPTVYICGKCVDLCVDIIERTKASGSAPPPPAQD